jgi:hypothetical protein
MIALSFACFIIPGILISYFFFFAVFAACLKSLALGELGFLVDLILSPEPASICDCDANRGLSDLGT